MNPTMEELRIPLLSDTLAQIDRLVAERRSIVLVGPQGTGAVMIARRIPSLLGELSELERAWIGAEREGANLGYGCPVQRPFRAPHYTISRAGLLGSTITTHQTQCASVRRLAGRCDCRKERVFRVGELQLARFGVLFLDEIAEFAFSSLEALASEWRAMACGRPLIVASAIPCPCGFRNSPNRNCSCTSETIVRYQGRLAKAADLFGAAPVSVPVLASIARALKQTDR